MGGPTGTGLTAAPSLARVPALALIDRRGDVVRETDAFRADVAPDETDRLSIWDFLESEQRAQLGRVLEGRLLRAELKLPSPSGVVVAEAEAVLDAAVMRHALLTVARPEPPGEPRPGSDVLLEDPSVEDSPAIVWIKDLDGRYLRVNKRYRERLGVDDAAIRGKTDAELPPAHVVGEPRSVGGGGRVEASQLEYTVDGVGGRDALTVLRFPLHGPEGDPVAVCGVAASVSDAATARSEAERLLRVERWAGLSLTAIRAELINEWELAELAPEPVVDPSPDRAAEIAGLRSELEAARESAGELEGRLASAEQEVQEARRRATELEASLAQEGARREALGAEVAAAAARADQLVSGAESERHRISELGAAVDSQRRRAEGAERTIAELRSRAEQADVEMAAARDRAGQLELGLAQERDAKLALEARLAQEAGRIAELHEAATAAANRADELAGGAASERDRIAALQAAADAQRERAEAAEQETMAAREQAESAGRDLAAARDRAARAEHEVLAAREQAVRAGNDLAAGREQLQAAAAEAAEERQRADAVERDLAAALRRADDADRILTAERSEATDARDELVARAERAESLLAQLHAAADGAAALAERAQATADLARERVQGLETELAAARAEHAATRAALEETQAQTTGLRAALDQARAESADLHGAVAQAEAGGAALRGALDQERAARAALEASLTHAQAEAESAREAAREAEVAAEEAREAARAAGEELERRRAVPEPAAPAAPGAAATLPAQPALAETAVHTPAMPALAAAAPIAHVTAASANGNAWNPGPMPLAAGPGPTWSLGAQRALTSSLASASQWRTGLKDALRILGTEGSWDVIITWCPDDRANVLRCAAMWMLAQGYRSHFETDTWQRRESPTTSSIGRVAGSEHATWLGDLGVVDDPQLAAAAREGMKGALLVPLQHDGERIGVLELLSAGAGAPGPDVVSAIEAVGLQLAHFEQRLRQNAEPRWRVGRL